MIYLLIIIGIIVCLGFGGWCGKLGCQSCEEEVKVLRRKLYEAEEEIERLKDSTEISIKTRDPATTSIISKVMKPTTSKINSKAINSDKEA